MISFSLYCIEEFDALCSCSLCADVCRLCLISVWHPLISVGPFPPCTPGLCLFSVPFPPHSSCTVHVCHSLPGFLAVCLIPLLPVRIVGKPFSEDSSSFGLSFFFPFNPQSWLMWLFVVSDRAFYLPIWNMCYFSPLVVFFLFLMFKWPLVVMCSYCTLHLDYSLLRQRCFLGSTHNKETIILVHSASLLGTPDKSDAAHVLEKSFWRL